ncbi:MAG TPA: glutamate--tRNA ligase [Verrucomicrobiae bacterium]|nr:glutamate--tRNA ligase [Verrucomicrobiae bacterium]
MSVRVRFAPSPTGPLHIGGARSALFNFLFAKANGGQFIVRSEDTDLERSSRESEVNILDSLRWLGIVWDEGVEAGGPNGPYRQTERLDIYRRYTDRLLEIGAAYYCFCSEAELEAEREELIAKGETPRYMGKCRSLTPEQVRQFMAQGLKPVVRFRVPENQDIVIDDLVRGQVVFNSNDVGDFVIVKSDGIPTYNFAVVVDDVTMKITHVLRGEEHLSNTPRQILIYKALQLPEPAFGHISLILGKDRSKMSKRHGSVSVIHYREQGYLPEAMVNFLALLGWAPPGEEEFFTLEQLIEVFGLDRVAKSPAVFDMDKLNYISGHYIRQSAPETIARLAMPYLQDAGLVPEELDEEKFQWVTGMVAAVQQHLVRVNQVVDFARVFFGSEVTLQSEVARAILQEEQVPTVMELFLVKLSEAEELTAASVKTLLKGIGKELKLGGKQVFMPIRVALTGETQGPELYDLIPLLGKGVAAARVKSAMDQLSN